MTRSQMVQTLPLLEENIDRYERLRDPTSAECEMYRCLWRVYSELKAQVAIGDAVAECASQLKVKNN